MHRWLAPPSCCSASQDADGGIGDLALGETPEARPKTVALALPRLGAGGPLPRRLRRRSRASSADSGTCWPTGRPTAAGPGGACAPTRPRARRATWSRAWRCGPSPLRRTRRTSREARRAAELLATRFLQPDRYPDRKAPAFWEQLGEPRFYTDVLDALDGVTAVGLGKENSGVRTAEAYVRGRQNPDGLWYPGAPAKPDAGSQGRRRASLAKERDAARWLTVRVLIVLRRVN